MTSSQHGAGATNSPITMENFEQCVCALTFPIAPPSRYSNVTDRKPLPTYLDDVPTTDFLSAGPAGNDGRCYHWWLTRPPLDFTSANRVEDALYKQVAVAICCFGLLGNAVNLVVLGIQHYPAHAGAARMQRFARLGLMALAVADSMFCLLVVPHAFVERDPLTTRINFSLFYSAYGEALINVFAMSGTWLTVGMAVGRYAAVCHPFRARATIGRTVALRAIVAVFCLCAVANVPRFLVHSIASIYCPVRDGELEPLVTDDPSRTFYYRRPGPVHARHNPGLEFAYFWAYFIAAFVVPIVVLLFTGGRLGFRLRRTRRDVERTTMTDLTAVTVRPSDIDRPFTVTLVAVAAMHVVLVSPAELLSFARWRMLHGGDSSAADSSSSGGGQAGGDEQYNLVASVLNTLQAANYSLNFLLYCAVNVAFRRRFVELVSCRGPTAVENHVRLQLVLSTGALDHTSAAFSATGRRELRRVTVLPADVEFDRLTNSETS